MRGIGAVAFDLDGTLYPNYRLYVRLLPFLCRHWRLVSALGKARSIIRAEQEHSSAPYPDFYSHQARIAADILHAQPEHIKEKVEKLIYRGWEPHFSKITLFPYVREFLAELRAAPFKLGLLSDFPPEIKLRNLNLGDCWDVVLCSENTGALKPAAHPFRELANSLGLPPDQILYVGNSLHYDAVGAKRAGMKTALLAGRFTGKTKADYTFSNYRQLRDFVLH